MDTMDGDGSGEVSFKVRRDALPPDSGQCIVRMRTFFLRLSLDLRQEFEVWWGQQKKKNHKQKPKDKLFGGFSFGGLFGP